MLKDVAVASTVIVVVAAAPLTLAVAQSVETLQRLSIEDLANVEVSSVSKTAQPLSDAPAAIYVISRDDIVRSGATSLIDILRLAPNLQVAQITAADYAVSSRGFNSSAADKLLVLIDGRSVYTPFFNGVLWDLQYVLPEDIDRIEVISGPGATLWGANAVNGVINIITRKESHTQGGVLELGGGNLEQRGSLQYGGKLSQDIDYRAYVTGFRYGNDRTATGANAHDSWHNFQTGFRADWTPDNDDVTMQGDFYRGSEDQVATGNQSITGHNLLARWNHQIDTESALQVQAYYDFIGESIPGISADFLDTYDFDVQHSFSFGTWQHIVWGGGYRLTNDNFPTDVSAAQGAFFVPQKSTLHLGDIFVEDTVAAGESVKIIPGLKLEADPFSRLEPLPSLRVSWEVTESDMVWAAVSRAVRAPSRLDRDLYENVGPVLFIKGGDFQPEKLIAYELGYRAQPSRDATVSISTYYNVYSDLRSAEYSATGLPIVFGNGMQGDTYGLEAWGSYRMTGWWKVTAGVDWLHKNLHFKTGSSGLGGIEIAGDDPTYQIALRSTMDVAPDVTFDCNLRRIAALPAPPSPSYTELDVNVRWAITSSLELSIRGSNLLQPHHLEFGSTEGSLQVGATGVETGRSFFVDTQWRF